MEIAAQSYRLGHSHTLTRARLEAVEGWQAILPEVPFLKLRPSWSIAVIPPFNGAAARFRIRDDKGGEVSVYLDAVEALGIYGGEVYWEAYPVDGDTFRCGVEDGDSLVKAIAKSLRQQAKEKAA